MPIYFHSHLVKISLKMHLNRKGTLSPSLFFLFYQSKKKPRKQKGENQIQSKSPHLLWSVSMRLPVGSLTDVAFPSSLWHVCSLSPGPAPSCRLGTNVSAELLKSCTQPFLILVWFERQSTRNESIKEPKRLWNMDTKLISFLSLTPATSQTNSYIQERCKCYCVPLRYSAFSSLQLQTEVFKLLRGCLENLA